MIYFKKSRLMIPFSSFVIVLLAFIYPLTVDASDNTTQSIMNNDPQVILQQTGEEDPYWTEEKMENAVPADMDTMLDKKETSETPIPQLENHQIGENLSHPIPPEANDLSPYAVVPSTSGKVFFTKSDGKNYVCSGSAINNVYKNLVMTAAIMFMKDHEVGGIPILDLPLPITREYPIMVYGNAYGTYI
jgi:hypothetical protein